MVEIKWLLHQFIVTTYQVSSMYMYRYRHQKESYENVENEIVEYENQPYEHQEESQWHWVFPMTEWEDLYEEY